MNQSLSNPLSDMTLDYSSGLPVWIQIKNRISYLIGSGEYTAGDRLPTVRSLALDLDISYNTVNRAYMDLERDGVIMTRKGRGTFVSEQISHPTNESDMQTLQLLVDECLQTARNAGMSDKDILEFIEQRIQHHANY